MRQLVFLILSLLSTFFTCFQSIALCSWFQPWFLLEFLHESHHLWKSSLAALFTHTVVSFLACWSLFPVLDDSISPAHGWLIEFFWAMALWVCLLLPFLVSFAYRRRFRNARDALPIVFASLWTGIWYVWNRYGQIGSLLSPAVTQFSIQPLVMTAGVWGVDGITFLMAWFSSLLFEIQRRQSQPGSTTVLKPKSCSMRVHKIHLNVFAACLVACLVYGDVRSGLFSGSFYQRDIAETMSPTVPVSCVLGKNLEYEETQVMLNKTEKRFEAGDRLVLWSEGAVHVAGSEARDALVSAASSIAKRHNGYVGITYIYDQVVASVNSSQGGRTMLNMFDFVLPDGSVGFTYAKSHLVPFMETTDTIAGELDLHVVDTEFGRIGGAICFDFEFPDFIHQAGQKRVDIVLQPAETWGPTGPYLYKSEIYRAVENGFTWFRCSTGGVSGIFNSYQRVIDYREATSTEVLVMSLPVDKNVWTFYSKFGFLFPFLLLVICCVHLVILCLPTQSLKVLMKNVPRVLLIYLTGPEVKLDDSLPLLL